MSQALYDDSSPRLSLSPPLSLSLCLTLFSLPLLSLFCAHCLLLLPSLPSPPSPFVTCLHKPEERSDSGDSRTHHGPSLNGNPPSVCLLVSGGGSHDSCTLDRGRKRITVSEIKAGKDNTHARTFTSHLSVSHTNSLPLLTYLRSFPVDPKVQSNNFFLCFFDCIQWMIY